MALYSNPLYFEDADTFDLELYCPFCGYPVPAIVKETKDRMGRPVTVNGCTRCGEAFILLRVDINVYRDEHCSSR